MKKKLILFLVAAFALLASCTTTQTVPPESSPKPELSTKPGPSIEDEKNVEQARKHRKLGERYLMGRDFVNAKKEFLVAARLDPSNWSIWGFAGSAAYYNSDFDEAIQYFNKLLELQPKNIKAYEYIGMTNKKLKRYDETIAAFEKVMELNSEGLWAPAQLADIYYELKEYDKCEYYMNMFETIISRENDESKPRRSKIKIENILKKFSDYRKAIAE